MFRRCVHPGLILKLELEELGITPTRFARLIDVPPNRVSQIIAGKRSVTADTALRIAHWFGMEPAFWMNLQAQFDLVMADKEFGQRVRQLPTKASDTALSGKPAPETGSRVTG
ncbi:MAG: HigA family addiction module antitoxin [Hyphomicrobiales bacterium]|jgi:addiction module HigA family antidote